METLVENLAAQVRHNCRVSDARSWGFHSICGLLLRLREQYKWEQGLEPWSKAETADVLPWIEQREAEWETLHEAEPGPLVIGGESIVSQATPSERSMRIGLLGLMDPPCAPTDARRLRRV